MFYYKKFHFIFRQVASLLTISQLTSPIDHGEGPVWDYRKCLLYYVDIHAGNVLSYDPATRAVHSIHFDGDVTPVIPAKHDPDVFVIGLNRSVVAVRWDGRSNTSEYRILTSVAEDKPNSRFNDGKADSKGRLWFGK